MYGYWFVAQIAVKSGTTTDCMRGELSNTLLLKRNVRLCFNAREISLFVYNKASNTRQKGVFNYLM